jgi:hypothetical protein
MKNTGNFVVWVRIRQQRLHHLMDIITKFFLRRSVMKPLIQLHPEDNLVVALSAHEKGASIGEFGGSTNAEIPAGLQD